MIGFAPELYQKYVISENLSLIEYELSSDGIRKIVYGTNIS